MTSQSTRTSGRPLINGRLTSDERETETDMMPDDFQDNVIMACNVGNKGDIGCCYYSARDEKLLLMSDVSNANLELLNSLKTSIQPTVVILPFRLSEAAEMRFDPDGKGQVDDSGDDRTVRLPYDLVYRPTAEFSYDAAKKRIVELPVEVSPIANASFITPGDHSSHGVHLGGHMPGHVTRQGRFLKVSAIIDMESRLSVGCAGAVLAYIERHKALHQLPGHISEVTAFQIATVEMFSVENMMFVNADTLASLQILRSDSSPNAHNQGPAKGVSGSKEGLSVYGLFHRLARTPQGRLLLRQWFSRPMLDLDAIQERLNAISVFLQPDNETPMKKVVKNMGQIKNLKSVLVRLQKGISSGTNKGGIRNGVWSNIRLFAFHSLQIKDAMAEIVGSDGLRIGRSVLTDFDTQTLALVGERIGEIVDFQASAEMHRTVVNPGVSTDLDHLKRSYNGMEHLLDRASQDIASTIPANFNVNLKVIFFPQIGFLISVPFNLEVGGVYYQGDSEDGWDHIFSTDDMKYYKDSRMREMDETWGDVYALICDTEIEIVHSLAQEILAQKEMLSRVSDLSGELDCLMALAQGARLYKFCRPELTRKNVIHIKGARHPLQELCVAAFVPNDIYLRGGSEPFPGISHDAEGNRAQGDVSDSDSESKRDAQPSMMIMTGPNFSGKSVYLKQIAIIVYMAHVGCFVPADAAVIGLTDKILTRVATRETVSRIQSAFMNDLQQVALATSLVTRRSLVLLDEFGKGTDSHDGVGLACGVFEHFLNRGAERPMVLAATHFHEMFENSFLKRTSWLAFGFMDVRVEKDAKEINDQVIYLYNVRSGRKTSSYGSFCAAQNGVDDAVVARSEELQNLSAHGEDLIAACAIVSRTEEENLTKAEEIAREFVAEDLKELFKSPEQARALLNMFK